MLVLPASAAILIGGRARRLGGQLKPLLSIGGRSILSREIDALRDIGVQHIVLIGRWTVDEPPPVPVLADIIDDGGALGGLYTALLVAPSERTFVMAGDMPFISPALLKTLVMQDADDAVVPVTAEGTHPLCGAYHRRVAMHVKACLDRGERTVRAAVDAMRLRQVGPAELSTIDPDSTMLMNVNTPADYERASQVARGCA
jgi:molybdopterin-guanine dinucleotide biosynthesis protein A